MKSVTIAGGGLAGLSLGIGLTERGVPVTLCEAGNYPRHRVCGEFISGVRDETLAALGIADLVRSSNRLESTAWFVGEEKVLEERLPVAAMGVSRFSLDQRLAERFVKRGGELRERERVEAAEDEGVVWAVGRQAHRSSEWIGLKVHARKMWTGSDLEMHLGKAGYVGTARVEEGRVNICGLFKMQEGVRGRGLGLLEGYLKRNGMSFLAARMARGDLDPISFAGVSAIRLGRQEQDGRCRVGDSERVIPPFTGNGMSMALEAAESALEPMTAYAEEECSWGEAVQWVGRRLEQRFAKRLRMARVIHPFLFSSLGRRMLMLGARSGIFPFQFLFRKLR